MPMFWWSRRVISHCGTPTSFLQFRVNHTTIFCHFITPKKVMEFWQAILVPWASSQLDPIVGHRSKISDTHKKHQLNNLINKQSSWDFWQTIPQVNHPCLEIDLLISRFSSKPPKTYSISAILTSSKFTQTLANRGRKTSFH